MSFLQQVSDEVYRGRRCSFGFDDAIIHNCEFRDIKSLSNSGGAVISFGSLEITDCLFELCQGREGGALSCRSALTLESVTFNECQARQAGAFHVISDTESQTQVNLSLLLKCKATYFGSLYRMAPGMFSLTHSNNTLSRADQCVGLFEMKDGSLSIDYSIFSHSSSLSHNGGICVRVPAVFEIEHCIFSKFEHTSSENDVGAVLLVYGSPQGAFIKNSDFVNNDPSGSHCLTVVHGDDVLIAGCCFTGSQAREISQRFVHIEDCTFESTVCHAVALTPVVGYVARAVRDEIEDQVIGFGSKDRPSLITIGIVSMVISIVCGIFLAYLQITLQRIWRFARLPTALQ
jgi:hypothetical protein